MDEQDTEVAVKAKKFKAETKGWLLYLCCWHGTVYIVLWGLAFTASHNTWVFSLGITVYFKKVMILYRLTPDCSRFTNSCKRIRTFRNKTCILAEFLAQQVCIQYPEDRKAALCKTRTCPIFFQEYSFLLSRNVFWHVSTYKKVRIWREMTLGNFCLNLRNTWTIAILWGAKTELWPQLFFPSLITYCVKKDFELWLQNLVQH